MISCIPPNPIDGTECRDEADEDPEFGDEQLVRRRMSGRMVRNFMQLDISDSRIDFGIHEIAR